MIMPVTAFRDCVVVMFCVGCSAVVVAQEQPTGPPTTREQAIAAERADKVAELWPERQNAMVNIANGFVERGLKEGLDTGKGANGFQFVLGGMRSGQGMSVGAGYRRSDLLKDQLGLRATARGTVRGAYMLDFDTDFQALRTHRTFLNWYTRFEHSPAIDYFGPGNTAAKDSRSSFLYDDLSSDFNASFQPVRFFRIGATGGYLHAHTAPSGEDGVPPIEETFTPDALAGFGEDTDYTRMGLFAYVDSRDSETGPRSGGLLGARYREYWDLERKLFAFRQAEIEGQKYFSYFNRSRVLAVRGSVVLSFAKDGNTVPMYLQPTIGGSDDLRGFVPYRFRDSHAVKLGVEHRWHAFSLLDMALFADAGKVVPLKKEVDPTKLHYAGGIGFRFRLRSAIVSRIDFAGSSEGMRFIWTFSDAFAPKY
jgi:outer membrane protein assembly factor BamA